MFTQKQLVVCDLLEIKDLIAFLTHCKLWFFKEIVKRETHNCLFLFNYLNWWTLLLLLKEKLKSDSVQQKCQPTIAHVAAHHKYEAVTGDVQCNLAFPFSFDQQTGSNFETYIFVLVKLQAFKKWSAISARCIGLEISFWPVLSHFFNIA